MKINLIIKIFLPTILIVFCVFNQIYTPKWSIYLQNSIFDHYQNIAPRISDTNHVYIIDIDEISLGKIGQWPWPRYIFSDLIEILNSEYKVAAIGFDILFSEVDRLSPNLIFKEINKKKDINIDPKVILNFDDYDTIFGNSINDAKNIVLSISLNSNTSENKYIKKSSQSLVGGDPMGNLIINENFVSNLEVFSKKAAGQGFINSAMDVDGIIRKVPVISTLKSFLDKKSYIVPSFGFELLRVAQNSNNFIIKSNKFGSLVYPIAIKNKEFTHKLDKSGNAWIKFSKFPQNRLIPINKILDKSYKGPLKNKIVIVGSSAAGLKDSILTPLESNIIGSEIHAQYIENAINNSFLEKPSYVNGLEIFFTIIFSIIIIFVVYYKSAIFSSILSLFFSLILICSSWFSFNYLNILVDPSLSLISAIGTWIIMTSIVYLDEQKEKRFLKNAFGRYLSPYMVEELSKNPNQLKLAGDNKIITVMFCDIRNFTSISETFVNKPEELTNILNNILNPLSEIILKHNGTIDKYMGDCIMAFWNAPLDNSEHGSDALLCSLEMIDSIKKLNFEIKNKFEVEEIAIGIGLNSGLATVGNMGSNLRLDYSIIGDCVNLCSRLEGQSKLLSVPIVIGENLVNGDFFGDNKESFLNEFQIIELDNVAVKGKAKGTKCYTILSSHNHIDNEYLSIHYQFLNRYYEGNFKQSLIKLKVLLKIKNILYEYYKTMEERCKSLDEQQIKDWNGITISKIK